MISLIVAILIKQYKPEFSIYISITAGILILIILLPKIKAIIDLLSNLSSKSVINNQFLMILIKITGIAFLTEFAVSLCKDANETSIANKIDMGGKVIIISMSIPIISALLQTVVKILP